MASNCVGGWCITWITQINVTLANRIKETLSDDFFRSLVAKDSLARLSETSLIIWRLIHLPPFKRTQMKRGGFCLSAFASLFTIAENDPQPDGRGLRWQRGIRHGELHPLFGFPSHSQTSFCDWFAKICFPLFLHPKGESLAEGPLCSFQAWWLTYFGKGKPNDLLANDSRRMKQVHWSEERHLPCCWKTCRLWSPYRDKSCFSSKKNLKNWL